MRLIRFFRTLRGKLILTYTTVTVLALLALEVTMLLLVFVLSHGQTPRGMSADLLAYLLRVVLGSGVVLLVAVAPFAALFGLIMSRGLTRRLANLTRAAEAWSEGDFAVRPDDRSRDELGHLGMRMQNMAERVQALLEAQEELALLEERNRLARELHDTVKQEIFATLMQVRAAKNLLARDPGAAGGHLDQAEELIKSAQQDLGHLIADLRPAALEGRGLAAALSDYVAAWSRRTRITAELQVQDERSLPLEIEQALFRVAQEALSNVARHSHASTVSVSLVFDRGQVTLCVADNGVGLVPAGDALQTGFGLQSMRDRMAGIRGSLNLRSAAGGGLILEATAPAQPGEQP